MKIGCPHLEYSLQFEFFHLKKDTQELEKGREGQQSDQRPRMASMRRMIELPGEEVLLQRTIRFLSLLSTKLRVAWRKWIGIEHSLCFPNTRTAAIR